MRWLTRMLPLASSVALAGAVAVALAAWVDIEQDLGLAFLYRARGALSPPDGVVVVAIEEESARRLGVPEKPRDWPRTLHAELVRALTQAGASVVVFDLTFDTPSARPADDQAFADALAEAGNVVVTESVHQEQLALADDQGRPAGTVVVDRPAPPIPVIEQAVAGHAPFMLPKLPRVDAWWTSRPGAADLPTLPVLALQVLAKAPRGAAHGGRAPHELQRIDEALSRVRSGPEAVYLNLYGPPRSVATVPYFRVLEMARRAAEGDAAGSVVGSAGDGLPSPAFFRGKAVFVGVSAGTAAGQDRLRDDYRTVFSQDDGLNHSGVELAATAFANLLDGRSLQPLSPASQVGVALVWALVLAGICQWLPLGRAALVCAALGALYLWWVIDRFTQASSWWPAVVPVDMQIPMALFASLGLRLRGLRQEREAIRRAFGRFLPSTVVDQLAQDLGPPTQGNRVVYGSCLATDAANYTSLAEQMEPARLAGLMNDYFAQLFVPVERSGGVVVDVVGDAMVAIWVAPSSDAGLRRNACEAALDIVQAVERFTLPLSNRPVLPTRLALHAGDMLVGNIGASQHYEYRAVGDIVNTASRLQGLNKVLGTRLLATSVTVDGLDGLVLRRLGSFVLVGKAATLSVVELAGREGQVTEACRQLCRQFELALACHDAGDWSGAAEQFASLLQAWPDDGPSRFYLARCHALMATPAPADWHPTIVVDAK